MVVLVVMMVLMIFASEKVLSMRCFSRGGGEHISVSRALHMMVVLVMSMMALMVFASE